MSHMDVQTWLIHWRVRLVQAAGFFCLPAFSLATDGKCSSFSFAAKRSRRMANLHQLDLRLYYLLPCFVVILRQ